MRDKAIRTVARGARQSTGKDRQIVSGRRLADLFLSSPSWAHRRVDALTLSGDGTTHRAISVDVTVPDFKLRPDNDFDVYDVVPLALIEKGALRRLSTADPAGHPMPVLGTHENSALAVEMLLGLIPDSWPSSRNAVDVQTILENIVGAPQAKSTAEGDLRRSLAKTAWREWLQQVSPPSSKADVEYAESLDRFVMGFLDHFLLVVKVKKELVGVRCVLKFDYDVDLPIIAGGTFVAAARLPLPDVGFARSQHIEVTVPSGLQIEALEVIEIVNGVPVAKIPGSGGTDRSSSHVALAPRDRSSGCEVPLEMTPVSGGILRFTQVALAAVSLIVGFAVLDKLDVISLISSYQIPSSSTSILLIGPALFLSWLARTPEHDAVAVLLLPLRRVLLYCTAVLIVLALCAAIPITPGAWELAWLLIAGTTCAAIVSYFAYVWSIPLLLELRVEDMNLEEDGDCVDDSMAAAPHQRTQK